MATDHSPVDDQRLPYLEPQVVTYTEDEILDRFNVVHGGSCSSGTLFGQHGNTL
jgi:hypothetical protein